jgi:hypothetical protein
MLKAQKVRLGFHGRSRQCPSCKSEKIRRSRRKGAFEKALSRVIFLYPYRCKECDERYFSFGLPGEPEVPPQTVPSAPSHASRG